ncbi:hypothetical protein L484_017429 [Morus notabilis]|uniref:Uncharacterized protein n=1 Tax=Morus notabilis TaxID=981085 RepID=W9R6C6_9ROSA|nr:hypothetical protein L484_017429 [Morus notabilis]
MFSVKLLLPLLLACRFAFGLLLRKMFRGTMLGPSVGSTLLLPFSFFSSLSVPPALFYFSLSSSLSLSREKKHGCVDLQWRRNADLLLTETERRGSGGDSATGVDLRRRDVLHDGDGGDPKLPLPVVAASGISDAPNEIRETNL